MWGVSMWPFLQLSLPCYPSPLSRSSGHRLWSGAPAGCGSTSLTCLWTDNKTEKRSTPYALLYKKAEIDHPPVTENIQEALESNKEETIKKVKGGMHPVLKGEFKGDFNVDVASSISIFIQQAKASQSRVRVWCLLSLE